MAKKLNKRQQLEGVIINKLQDMNCKVPNECFEVLGAATLHLLKSTGEFIGVGFETMRKEYVRGLMAAEVENQ